MIDDCNDVGFEVPEGFLLMSSSLRVLLCSCLNPISVKLLWDCPVQTEVTADSNETFDTQSVSFF